MSTSTQILIGIAASLTALGVIWRKGVRPAWRGWKRLHEGIEKITEAAPTLFEIAKDFDTNGGGSLRDSIDRIEQAAIDAAATVTVTATKLAATAEDTATKLAATAEDTATQLAKEVASAAAKVAENHTELIVLVGEIGAELHEHVEEDREAFGRIEAREAGLPRIETVEQAATRVADSEPSGDEPS